MENRYARMRSPRKRLSRAYERANEQHAFPRRSWLSGKRVSHGKDELTLSNSCSFQASS